MELVNAIVAEVQFDHDAQVPEGILVDAPDDVRVQVQLLQVHQASIFKRVLLQEHNTVVSQVQLLDLRAQRDGHRGVTGTLTVRQLPVAGVGTLAIGGTGLVPVGQHGRDHQHRPRRPPRPHARPWPAHHAPAAAAGVAAGAPPPPRPSPGAHLRHDLKDAAMVSGSLARPSRDVYVCVYISFTTPVT